jgi:hypothetical protein
MTPSRHHVDPTALVVVGTIVYRPETRFRAVSWRFAARSSARLGPSRGAAVAALPVDAVLARIVRSAGSV